MTANSFLLASYALLAMGLAHWQGQDVNWDLLNYHFYNPYMWMNGRFARDVHVAGVQSFFNPLVDLPFYAAVRSNVPPHVFFLSLAAFQGTGLFIVHRVAMLVTPRCSPVASHAFGILAGVTAAFGAGFLSEIGNTMHDSTLSVLVLAALWILLIEWRRADGPSTRQLMFAGGMCGAAVGMKLALGPLCAGLAVTVLMFPGSLRDRCRHFFVFSTGAGAAMAATAGYWMWLMYRHFGSPLFPFFNALFQSPFAPSVNFSDDRFLPKTLFETAFYPFYWISTQNLVAEPPFRDARFAAVLLALAMLGLFALLSRIWEQDRRWDCRIKQLFAVAIFWASSYAIWLNMFSIYRYVIALEMLGGVMVIGVAGALTAGWPRLMALVFPICVALSLGMQVPNFGRIAWSDSYFGVDVDAMRKYDGAMILMWDFPQGYLAPLFPSSATFVRLVSNWGLEEGTSMWRRVSESVSRADPDRLYLLDHPLSSHEQQAAMLARLGLRPLGACETHPSHHFGFRLCAVEPLPR